MIYVMASGTETSVSATFNGTAPGLNISGLLANLQVRFDVNIIKPELCELRGGSALTSV